MMKMYASMGMNMGGDFPVDYTLVLNSNSPLMTKLEAIRESDEQKARLMALEIYRLALMSQKRMSADELKSFLSDSFTLLGMM
jgi:HSP90 family molecular chaperone